MYVPYTMPEGHQRVANWGYVAAERNDIPYLNFVYEDLKIDYATDCADEGHHLNASGARKLTDYLGDGINVGGTLTVTSSLNSAPFSSPGDGFRSAVPSSSHLL